MKKIILFINITDKYEFSCRLINYLRYFLRFTSAYIIVAFTVQRLILIYSPLSDRFKSKKSAWITVLITVFISILINLWVPFLFTLQDTGSNKKYCDVEKIWKNTYFIITIVYTTLIMLVPVITIIICNYLIMFKTKKADLLRKSLQYVKKPSGITNTAITNSRVGVKRKENYKLKPYYKTANNKIHIKENSKKLANILFLISFSYAFLNLPYLFSWYFFYYQVQFNIIDESDKNYLFGVVQITEILYILNYGLKFYIYCASGSIFRSQLRYSSINIKFFKSRYHACRNHVMTRFNIFLILILDFHNLYSMTEPKFTKD